MDLVEFRNKFRLFAQKYKYVALVLVLGVALMLLPEFHETTEASYTPTLEEQTDLARQLEEILSLMDGVGKVKVLLTEAEGSRTLYQQDEERDDRADAASIRLETVILTNAQRTEQGLVQQILPPTYAGALIVCQGADRSSVELKIVEAVADITGLSTNRITVLKMK